MSDIGKLCYKRGMSDRPLCYKYGRSDRPLIKKAQGVEQTIIDCELNPVHWHCNEYDQDHTAQVTCSGSFATGSGSFTVSQSGTTWTFTISKTSHTQATTFRIVFQVTDTGCTSSEDPGVMATAVATQMTGSGVVKTKQAVVPVKSDGSITVSFDSSGHLVSMS